MRGPGIIARTLSGMHVTDSRGHLWQYHSRSDHHSKVACWAVLFDMLEQSSLLRDHVAAGKVAFGINRQINDWATGRRKNLDMVVARAADAATGAPTFDLAARADHYQVALTDDERSALGELPTSPAEASGATVLVALEAKACMTEHGKARPRLYDELTSSHATVHGDNTNALAVGLVMLNAADTFVSPGRQTGAQPVVNHHYQPAAAQSVMDKLREIKRRPGPRTGEGGFDAFGVVVVNMRNDGSPVTLDTDPPAPQPSDDFYYDRMILRAAHRYDSDFGNV